MGWHVRYLDLALKHEMLSREWGTEGEALEDAWNLAQQDGKEITAIEGPDEELVPMEEIQAWFERGLRPDAMTAVAGEAGADIFAADRRLARLMN
jgi:hypothetical protein